MIAPRVLAVTGAAVALLLVGVIVGKHEGSTANAKQIAEISSIKQLVGDRLDSPTLAAFRFNPGFACLIYRVDTNRFALRLCFDGSLRRRTFAQGARCMAASRTSLRSHHFASRQNGSLRSSAATV